VSEHAHRTDRDNLASLPSSLLDRPIVAVTQADVLDALTVLLATRAHSTVSRTRTSVSALFTWAARERYLTPSAHPVRGLRMPSGTVQAQAVEWFTPNDVRELLVAHHALSPHYALATEWLALTGQRWSEARATRVRDVQDLPHPAVHIHRAQSDGYREKGPKTRRGVRVVPLVERAREIAAEFAAGKKPDDYLLTTTTGKQMRATLYRRYTKWTATARGRHVHHLRHFAASEWLRRGVPINQAAVWLGDDPRTVLQVYAHVMGEQQDREMLKLLNRSEELGPSGDPRGTNQALSPITKKRGRA
jgi:integrase